MSSYPKGAPPSLTKYWRNFAVDRSLTQQETMRGKEERNSALSNKYQHIWHRLFRQRDEGDLSTQCLLYSVPVDENLILTTDKASWEVLGPALSPSSSLPHGSRNPQTSPWSMQPGDIKKSWQRHALRYAGHRESAGKHSPVHGAQKWCLHSGRSRAQLAEGQEEVRARQGTFWRGFL